AGKVLWQVWPPGPLDALSGSHGLTFTEDTIEGWDLRDGNEAVGTLHRYGVAGLGFSGDGRTLVSAGLEGLLLRWDVRTGRVLGRATAQGCPETGGMLSVSRDGKRAAM